MFSKTSGAKTTKNLYHVLWGSQFFQNIAKLQPTETSLTLVSSTDALIEFCWYFDTSFFNTLI